MSSRHARFPPALFAGLALVVLAGSAAAQWPVERELQHILKPVESKALGSAVALDGDEAAVIDEWGNGGVHLLAWDGFAWTLKQTLLSDSVPFTKTYGSSVALSGDLLVVGEPTHSFHGVGSYEGAAWVYRRVAGSWAFDELLRAPDATANGGFGTAVAIRGDGLVAVGANGVGPGGSVFLFRRGASHWSLQSVLSPADLVPSALFGSSIVFADGLLIVDAAWDIPPGSIESQQGDVRVFEEQGGAWVQRQLVHGDNAMEHYNFGDRLAAGDGWLAASALTSVSPPVAPGGSGAVFLFELVNGSYVPSQVIGSPGPETLIEDFDRAIALDGDWLLVGAPDSESPPYVNVGRVFAYHHAANGWTLDRELACSTLGNSAHMGVSVAAGAGHVLAGVPGFGNGGFGPGALEAFALGTPGVTTLGHGLAGGAGSPVLQAIGAPLPGAAFELRLGGAAALAPVIVVAGGSEVDKKLKSGVLVPAPEIIGLGWITDALGHVQQPATWPTDAAGLDVVLQAWVLDATAPSHWSATNGLRVELP